MSERSPLRVVIVGGGASGALMAAHLLRPGRGNIHVTIIETRAQIGRGLAYATDNPRHLLNVRAANMSAFADDPGHFARWLSRHADEPGIAGDPEFQFVSRGLYGRYLESLVREPRANAGALTIVCAQAREARVGPESVEIVLAQGPPIFADMAILACGHESVGRQGPLYVSPWSDAIGGDAPLDATLLIEGAGLTMVDAALALEARGHRGRIVAISRRGLLPHAHVKVDAVRIDEGAAPFDQDLSRQLRWLRALARTVEANGGDWRSVVDGLRPHTQAIWRAMSPRRRRRFLEHARPWWDTHRHRMAPQVAERLHAIIAQKRLEVIAGRIIDVAANAAGARVTLRRRGSLATERIDVARIVSCTGVGSRLEASANPLVASLFAARQARADPLRIGVEVSPDCAILDAEGQASRRLFAIGPMSQAAFWEITAVPDIRLQAAELAATILNRANSEAVFNSLPATCR